MRIDPFNQFMQEIAAHLYTQTGDPRFAPNAPRDYTPISHAIADLLADRLLPAPVQPNETTEDDLVIRHNGMNYYREDHIEFYTPQQRQAAAHLLNKINESVTDDITGTALIGHSVSEDVLWFIKRIAQTK